MPQKKFKIVYCTPALYMAGGVERVLTLKANYMAEEYGYDITIITTEGKGKPLFYELSDKIKVVNLDINFEELWHCPFAAKIFKYLKKQRLYKSRLRKCLMDMRPDITISLLRREINFINDIPDGSAKIGELHVNRANYRNFTDGDTNIVKRIFAKYWSKSLVGHLKRLNTLVVLTDKDKEAWVELDNVVTIPNPLPFEPQMMAQGETRRVLFVGRYSIEKGIDRLLEIWTMVQNKHAGWTLDVFGEGDRQPYEQQMQRLGIDPGRCRLNGRTSDVRGEYSRSALLVCTSRFEGFGMVIAEAMACGLPVVAFDCPWGPRSIITDGADGLLVENGNIELFARKLSMLMADAEQRRRMSEMAVANIANYNISNICSKWKRLFENKATKKHNEI